MKSVSIVGAGLAGCEAALQLVSHGYKVTLYDSKPLELLETYRLPTFAELVCNNSLGNLSRQTPLGLLLQELKALRSRLILIAENCRIDDPKSLTVDKKEFSKFVTDELNAYGVKLVNRHLSKLPEDDYVLVATGPLTDEGLIRDLAAKFGIDEYHFFDASSPVVDIRTVDLNNSNLKKITDDLYAVSIPVHFFEMFNNEIVRQSVNSKCHNVDKKVNFEECQSIENLAIRGIEQLYSKRFKHDYFNTPCLLLRRENAFDNGFILVGCTTALPHSAQLSAFSLIPSLEKCKLIKYGRMHRNTFLNAPKVLDQFFQIKGTNTYIIGQLSGIDGYAPAIASGWVSAMRIICGDSMQDLPQCTMIGSLAHYISCVDVTDFQPMCASFSIMTQTNDFIKASTLGVESIINSISDKL